jgi:isocitrate dehydrogenase kinase/phosphatase
LAVRSATARAAAAAAARAYAAWDSDFRWATRRAGARFAARDWAGAEADAARRLALWYRWVDAAVADARRYLGAAVGDRALWAAARDAYAAEVDGRDDGEVAESFYNSFARRVLRTPGLDPALHFVRPARRAHVAGDAPGPTADADAAAIARPLPVAEGPEAVARALLAAWRGPAPLSAPFDVPRAPAAYERLAGSVEGAPPPRAWPALAAAAGDPRWRDFERDVGRVARALEREARDALGGWPDRGDVACAPFFRGQAAYVVGRLERGPLGAGARRCPVVVALRHPDGGVEADAVLLGEDEVSIVFGFAWSYFHVEARRPRALVDYVASVLPRKRVDELYTAVGYHRHAKTELFRALHAHLNDPRAGPRRALRAAPRRARARDGVRRAAVARARAQVHQGPVRRAQAHHAARGDGALPVRVRARPRGAARRRAGVRGARLPRRHFPEALLAELAAVAPTAVRPDGDRVLVTHCYTERQLAPLDVYARTAPPDDAARAIVEYGQAIRDLAVAGIFAGDLLLKNFGVSRHGRVIFYDYDELTSIAECRFLALPDLGDDEDFAPEPTYGVHEHDVFPEEFARFAVPQGPLREAFTAAHGDLLDPAWWEATQRRLAEGELVETFPYPQHRRLGV